MKKQESCKTCEHLEQIPFAGFICKCKDSDYFNCECNPKEDLCVYYKDRSKD